MGRVVARGVAAVAVASNSAVRSLGRRIGPPAAAAAAVVVVVAVVHVDTPVAVMMDMEPRRRRPQPSWKQAAWRGAVEVWRKGDGQGGRGVRVAEGKTDLLGGRVSLVCGFAGCVKSVKSLLRLSHGMM